MPESSGRILFIDDEPNVLQAVRRQLRRDYDIAIAAGPDEALPLLSGDDAFAVVVCDMHMPGMNGLEMLARCQRAWPDAVRVMLTGDSDQSTAIDAINQGAIFRFLNKPCTDGQLRTAIDAALKQRRLITAEKELLEKTLAGSVRVLIDVLSLLDPAAYGRAARLREWARAASNACGIASRWEIEMAAMLSPLGRVALPPEVVLKQQARRPLAPAERDMLARSPETARNLIRNIPRMRGVAEIVHYQDKQFDGEGFPYDGRAGTDLPLGARLLKLLAALAEASPGDHPSPSALDALERTSGIFDPDLIERLRPWVGRSRADQTETALIPVSSLAAGQLLRSDIATDDGHLILAAGVRLTEAQIERLRNLMRLYRFGRPVEVEMARVAIPA